MPSTSEIISVLAVLISGGFVIWGEYVKRRTPSAEKEDEQEKQWRDDLWARNRDMETDLKAKRAELKEADAVIDKLEQQNELLSKQLAILQQKEREWDREKESLLTRLNLAEENIKWLNSQITRIRKLAADKGVSVDDGNGEPTRAV